MAVAQVGESRPVFALRACGKCRPDDTDQSLQNRKLNAYRNSLWSCRMQDSEHVFGNHDPEQAAPEA